MKIVEYVLLCILMLVIVFIWLYIQNRAKWCRNFTCLVGKTVLITGANKEKWLPMNFAGSVTGLSMLKLQAKLDNKNGLEIILKVSKEKRKDDHHLHLATRQLPIEMHTECREKYTMKRPSGLGYHSALDFAKRGARVILACRNQELANEARDRIINLSQNHNIVVKYVDFTSLETVRALAKDICETEKRLDILVNNAGAALVTGKITQDGFPEMMQINYYGHVLLIFLLLDILRKSAPCRICNLSSILAVYAVKFNFNYLNNPPKFFPNKWINGLYAYMTSKLAVILFTQRIAQLLRNDKIYMFSVHPGIVQTDIVEFFSGPVKLLWKFFVRLYAKTVEEGAQTIIYTATEPEIETFSGEHFDNCRMVPSYYNARNTSEQIKLFNGTLEILGFDKDLKQIVH